MEEEEKKQDNVASDTIGQFIAAQANQAITDRTWCEDLWLDDMRQLKDVCVSGGTSREHTHNITKEKTLIAEARISDMLFQAGDKNFAVEPDKDIPPKQSTQMEEASDKLENSITNKLDESNYETHGRKAIKYACELGVGVIKGPVKVVNKQKTWEQLQTEDGNVVNKLTVEIGTKAGVEHVSTWDYFPDMSVEKQEDCAYEFQRHWMSKTDLQELLLRPDFNHEEVLAIINTETPASQPRHLVELRDNSLPNSYSERFVIWEGYTTVPVSEIRELRTQEPERQGNFCECDDDITENFDVRVHAWVSDSGKLLKFSPSLLETDERPFGVFCYDRDSACFMASAGIPRLLRKAQRDVDGSWDRIHDNSDLSVGPQFVVDTSRVEPIPVNGKMDWNMTANKGWRTKRPGVDPSGAFHFFNVPSGVQENMAILDKSLEFADKETQLPQLVSGEVTAGQTRMAHETFSLLFNAAGSIPRRIIKDWDDHVTIPLIGRMIDYTLQYEPEVGVFGRFIPNAQGTSSLLLKETLAKNAMALSQISASNPKYAERTNWKQLYDRIIRSLQFDPAVVTYTDEELEKQRAENPPQPSPEQIEAQANLLEAQNEQKKIAIQAQKDKMDYDLKNRELQSKINKAKAETRVAVMKVQLEEKKLIGGAKGKVTGEIIKGKVKAETEKLKAENEKEKIRMKSKADESAQVNEYLLEGQREGAQINQT